MLALPSSMSVAEAVQVKTVPMTTPVLGLMLALAVNEGGVFSMLTEALAVSLPPWGSVAVAEQVMLSEGAIKLGES